MNISYNWLKDYLDFDLQPDEVAAALTSIGLETGGVEEVQTIKGGLEGLVIGEVLTCEEHPNSDHLHITTVNVGGAASASPVRSDSLTCIWPSRTMASAQIWSPAENSTMSSRTSRSVRTAVR